MFLISNVGQTILNIVLFLVALSLVVCLHELGHFTAAKIFKVYCKEFSIGFGPKLFSIKGKKAETAFSVRIIPLGGYVSMVGEGDEEETNPELNVPKERSLEGVSAWKKLIIFSAGIIMNFIVAIGIFVIDRTCCKQNIGTCQVLVTEGSEAETLGMQDYDTVYSMTISKYINGTNEEPVTYEVDDYYSLWDNLSFDAPSTASDTITIEMSTYRDTAGTAYDYSDDETHNYTLTISAVLNDDGSFTWDSDNLGLNPYTYKARLTFGYGLKTAFNDFGYSFTMIAKSIGQLLIGKGYENLGGPIAIFKQSSEALTQYGFGTFLWLWGAISVNLGLFNLLPFPGLDGWHIVVTAYEGIFRRKIPNKVKNIVSLIGMIILFALMAVILVKDIINFTGVLLVL